MRKFSVFSLVLCFTIFMSELSAFSTKVEKGTPSLRIMGIYASPADGVIYLITIAPDHLAFCNDYSLSNEENCAGIEGNLILATYPSKNPQTISFQVSAQNVEGGGIDFTITETQASKKEGWFTDTWSEEIATQVIHEPFRSLDISEETELHIKQDEHHKTLIKFKLSGS